MAESHIVSGLVAKHSELAGLIQFHRTEMERVAVSLQHLDATLKLLAPEIDLRSLGTKRVRQSSVGGFKRFKSKESHTWVLDQLREAAQPITSGVMAERIIVAKGLEDTQELRTSIQRTLTGTLRRLEQRGLVIDVGRAENGLSALWQIA